MEDHTNETVRETLVLNFPSVCGAKGNSFFNQTESWNTSNPDVSLCFREIVLIWLPCAYFWLCLPIRMKQIFQKRGHVVQERISPLNICKTTVCGFLALIAVIDLIFSVQGTGNMHNEITVAGIVDPVMRLLTFSAIIGLLQVERRNGFITSWVQFFFWLIFLIGGTAGLYSNIQGIINESIPTSLFITYCLTIAGGLISFILQFWAEPLPNYSSPSSGVDTSTGHEGIRCPKLSASFPSELAFSWFTSFAWTGFKRALTKDDLWELPPELTSRQIVPNFKRYWDPAVQRALRHNITLPDTNASTTLNGANGDVSFNTKSNQIDINASPKGKNQEESKPLENRKMARIFPALVKAFGPRFLAGSLLKLVHDLLIYIPPYILKRIIAFAKGEEEMWKGIVYACILLITATVQTIVLGRYFYDMYAVGIKIRSSVISSIYSKSLKVSPSGKKEATTGEVVNLMSVDVQRMVDLMPYFNMLWSAPLQIVLCITFLWQILGPSVLAGLLVMILLVPLNGFIAMKQKALQVKQMKEKDKRVKMMNEIMQGIKILKLYAWERSFQGAVTTIRDKEIQILRHMGYLAAGTSFVWACAPFVVSLVTFATYVLSSPDNLLDAEKAFVALALFNILRFPLSMLPMMISGMVQASVSVKRIDKYMNASELNENAVTKINSSNNGTITNADDLSQNKATHLNSNNVAINMKDASFKWSTDEQNVCLQNISFEIPKQSLVAVVGQVGSGKSSLLSAILGEMEPFLHKSDANEHPSKDDSCSVVVDGSIAYAAQQAWIQNATLKNNILFSKAVDESRYQKVIDACALIPDLEMLSAGDETEIGEKGINLSGGQKQRVSLARASYSDADIYLLDDPLSAVDSHVGKHIFENVIGANGILSSKTRILVTHSLTYLPNTDKIIVMKNGKISEIGSYSELLSKKGDFAEFLIQYLSKSENSDGSEDAEELDDKIRKDLEVTIGKEALQTQIKERKMSESRDMSSSVGSLSSLTSPAVNSRNNLSRSMSRDTSPKKRLNSNASAHQEANTAAARQNSITSTDGKRQKTDTNSKTEVKNNAKAGTTQYEAEKAETGKVSIYVYLYYLKSMGIMLTSTCAFFFTLNQICSASSSIWLSKWSDDMSQTIYNASQNESDLHNRQATRNLYLGVYGGLGLGQAVAVIFASLFLYISTLTGANKLHHIMLGNVLRSPMSFFDTTPQGRILNRFGKDVDVLDSTMPMIIRGWMTCLLAVLSTFLIIAYTTPTFILPIAVILTCYYLVQKVYVATSRQLKRLESVSRSPIYSQFGETINGASTIRAYGLEKQFIRHSQLMVDENQKANFPSVISNRWLAVRLETVGNLIIFCASLLAVLGRGNLTPGLVGLSVSYALSVTQTLNWLVRMTSEVETNIVAVERLKEYSESVTEAEWENPNTKPDEKWPSKGNIRVQGYSTRYRENLDLVLKTVSFDVEGGKKVGIVGRTGAGKSSFTLALFRIIEAAEGSIFIDGINIASLGLHELRSKITIIPQDPVLFSGSLRMNLDPFNVYSDEKLWEALKLAHLEEFVSTLNEGLSYEIAEGGENLSVGQRQLVCLARALLRKTKILVLDEATAAVDLETDELIQATIRKEFSDCTILTIAHRLSTIMDYDKILVLQNGEKVEYDSPEKLKGDSNGIFYSMCKDAGLVN